MKGNQRWLSVATLLIAFTLIIVICSITKLGKAHIAGLLIGEGKNHSDA